MITRVCSERVLVERAQRKGDRPLLKQGIWLLFLFSGCLSIGCLLLLPFGPPFREKSSIFLQWLLPFVFSWWGIVTPVVAYWLFRQFLLCWQNHSLSQQAIPHSAVPILPHLSLSDLKNRQRRSRDREQRKQYQILALALQGYPLEAIVKETGADEESIAALILSYNTWGSAILRTRSKRLIQPVAQLLRYGAYRQRTMRTPGTRYRSAVHPANDRSQLQAAG